MEGAKIRVIGLGGGGNNAVNRMIEAGLEGVEFISANTDAQVLATSHAECRIQLGDRLTKGLGAGANPEIGERAAQEDRSRIKEYLDGSDMIFITAGMGGGTGTGSAPIVAQIAREVGALTIAVVTSPFAMEGPKRARIAQEGIRRLREHVDALIVVSNERLLAVVDRKTTMQQAFLLADRVLYHGVKGITDIINVPGVINVDFADVRNILTGAGSVIMGIGAGQGENLVQEAAHTAINSPLLENGIKGAKNLLINIAGSDRLTLHDAQAIVKAVSEATEETDPNVLFGVTQSPQLGDEVRVIVVATGFEQPAGAAIASTSLAARRSALGQGQTFDPADIEIPAFLRYPTSKCAPEPVSRKD